VTRGRHLDDRVLDDLADAILERCALVAKDPVCGAEEPEVDGQLDGLATACVEQWATGGRDGSC
jgi:hypothetical protein